MEPNKLRENLSSEKVHQEATKASEKPKSDAEVKRAASEVMQQAGTESAESQEGVESGTGRVSEQASEDKNQAATGGAKRSYSADEVEAIRAKLLAALPPQDQMIREIRKKLYKEEEILVKRMKKLQKNSHTQAFQLTIVVRQLRKVREYFSTLAHATYEMIKHLWLKIVHGV